MACCCCMEQEQQERDYVLGTADQEVARLGIQHRVWRRHALDGWFDAGFTAGQTIVDVGCGPGYATADLADIAGSRGRVIAIDRSRRFLNEIREAARDNVTVVEADLDDDPFPPMSADAAWARWVFAFVRHPRELLRKVRGGLRSGARFVIHEYFHYATWRFAPRSEPFEHFVATVMKSWRDNGGEPDIALDLPTWLLEAGFTITRLRPIVEVISPADFTWQWPASFIESGLDRLHDLGYVTADMAQRIRADVATRAATPGTRMITPAVMEIIATAS